MKNEISVKEWAEKQGITIQAANKRIRTLGIGRAPGGGIYEIAANAVVAGSGTARASKQQPEVLNEARTRRESAKADHARVEADLALGAVVKTAEVMKIWGVMISPAKTKLMSMGAKLGPMMAVESDAAACKALIDGAVREALAEIAEYGAAA